MNRIQKKLTALGLLLLVVLPFFISVSFFIKQKLIHHQRIQRFETEFLQTVTVSAKNLLWIKSGKEIILDGKLFDVKSLKTDGNVIVLTGFYDGKEDNLVKHIKKLTQQKNGSDNPVNELAVKFLFFPIYSWQSEITYEAAWKFTSNKFYSFTVKIPEALSSSFSPPPEL